MLGTGGRAAYPENVVPKSTPTISLSGMGAKSPVVPRTGPLIASADDEWA